MESTDAVGKNGDESESAARRHHRGTGKALTWDQFSFDKILPEIQAEFSAESMLQGDQQQGSVNWFDNNTSGEFAGSEFLSGGASPSPFHKRSATIDHAPGTHDGFDLSAISALLGGSSDETVQSENLVLNNGTSVAKESSSPSYFQGVGSPSNGELDMIHEPGYKVPRHRRSRTHAVTSTFGSFAEEGELDLSPNLDSSSFDANTWATSLNTYPNHGSRTKSDSLAELDLSSLRERGESLKIYSDSDVNHHASPPSAMSSSSSLQRSQGKISGHSSPSPRNTQNGQTYSGHTKQQQPSSMFANHSGYQIQQEQEQQWYKQQQMHHQQQPWEMNRSTSPHMMPYQYVQPMITSHPQRYGSPSEMGSPSPQDIHWMQQQQQYNMYYQQQQPQPHYAAGMVQSHHVYQGGHISPHLSPSSRVSPSSQSMGSGNSPNEAYALRNGNTNNGVNSHRNKGNNGMKTNPSGRPMCPALVDYRNSGRRPEMRELINHVVEFSRDAHGSRFIQFKMETASNEEKEILVNEVAQDAVGLMQDTFGNYVMQNFLEHTTAEQRYKLGNTMKNHMVELSSQAHGCRVVQRAIILLPVDLRNELLGELLMDSNDTGKCARNSHATHVMQKVVGLIVSEQAEGITHEAHVEPRTDSLLRAVERSVQDDFVSLSVHPHAYRLVLTVMDDCNPSRSMSLGKILNELLPYHMGRLAKDQHGNFVLQHVLNRGNESQKDLVQQFVADHVVELAQHKFGSHLVEKSLACATPFQVETLVEQLVSPTGQNAEQSILLAKHTAVGNNKLDRHGNNKGTPKRENFDASEDTLLLLMSDPYANFVVQRAFDASQGALRSRLVDEIKSRSDVLSKFTYGRHALQHLSKALGERGPSRSTANGSNHRSARRKK